jgi:hypothetical protein
MSIVQASIFSSLLGPMKQPCNTCYGIQCYVATMVTVHIVVLWVVTQCSVVSTNILEEYIASILKVETVGSSEMLVTDD